MMLFKAFPCYCKTQVFAGVFPLFILTVYHQAFASFGLFLRIISGKTGSVGQSVEPVMSVAKLLTKMLD